MKKKNKLLIAGLLVVVLFSALIYGFHRHKTYKHGYCFYDDTLHTTACATSN